MATATYGELLRSNRNFRRLWVGQLISELGSWFSFIAELGVVRLYSGSPLVTTALLVARLLPFLLVAPVAGVFVDRRSRKRIMIWSDLLRAVVAIVFLAATWLGSAWIVVACSVLMSSLTMFFEAAKNAAMPNLVAPRELLTANVLMFSTRFLQFTLGSALGGLTAAQFGYEVAFIVNSLSFVASAAFIALIPLHTMRAGLGVAHAAGLRPSITARERSEAGNETNRLPDPMSADAAGAVPIAGSEQPAEPDGSGRFIEDLRGGLAYIWATPFVRAVILVNVAWATGGGMTNILFDQMGGRVFAGASADRGDWVVAALFTAGGAGLFAGMMLARRAGIWVAHPRRAGRFIGWSLLAHGLLFAGGGLMPSLGLIALFVGASRLLLGMEFGVQETLMMRVLPDSYRGRVFTTDRSLELTMMALSTLIAGWLLTWVSPRALMVAAGLLSATPGLAWLIAMAFASFSVPARAVQESYGD
jgi:MFS family permease